MFCYSESEVFTGSPIPYHLVNANRSWLRHYENKLYLEFMEVNGSLNERKQAVAELRICARKMSRMEKHANFSMSDIVADIDKLNKSWRRS